MIIETSLMAAKRDYSFTVKDKFSGFPKTFRMYYDNKDGTANIPIGGNNWLTSNICHDSLIDCRYTGTKTLREEQAYIINTIRDDKLFSGTIMMKTGRGKTLVMLKLIEMFRKPTLILCHNKDNVDMITEAINDEMNVKAGRVRSGEKKEYEIVCVTTHAGFRAKPETYSYEGKPYGVILYDECDYNLSFPKGRNPKQPSMSTSLINYGAEIMFGLSGTPFLKDLGELGVTKMFGPMIKMEDQENGGYNIIPTIEINEYTSEGFYLYEDWHQLVKVMQDDDDRTAEVVDYIYDKAGKYNLALFKYVAEVDKFYELVTMKIDTEFESSIGAPMVIKLHGQMTDTEYDSEMTVLKICIDSERPFIIVGTTDKIGRGKDIPIIDTMFLLYPCKFEGNVVQAVGRGLRRYPGKDKVMLYDWRDMHPVFLSQGKKRAAVYKKEYPGCQITLNQQ